MTTPRSFYARQALYLSVALAVLLAAYHWLANSAWLRPDATDHSVDALTVAELLARVDSDGAEELRAALGAAMRARSVDAVWLTVDGRVTAYAERRDERVRILTGPSANVLQAPAPDARPFQPGSGEHVRMVVMSRRLDPEAHATRGNVYVKPSPASAPAGFGEWVGYVVAFLTALGAGLLLLERIIRPVSTDLARIVDYARRLEDSPAPPATPSASEFAELARALGQTSARIAEQRALARAAHDRLVAAIEGIEDGFVLFDADDRLVICNKPYLRMNERIADKIRPGERFEDIVREGVSAGQYELGGAAPEDWIVERLARHQAADGSVLTQRQHDGRWMRISEHRTSDGGRVGFRVDVTEIVRARALAEAANSAKTDFLANMSHELRTPLNGVIGMLELLGSSRVDPEQAEYIRIASGSAQALLEIISDVLDVAKIESGRLELEFVPVQPAVEVRAVARAFENAAHAKGLSLEVRDRLGAQARLADPARLRQVMRNLVSNAIKFTQRGGVELRIAEEAGGVRFEVADTGIGIPESFRPHLFQPFAQADASVTRRFGGTGLGLAITRDIVLRMGGRIDVDSASGRGTTFSVFLPLAPATAADASPAPPDDADQGSLYGLDVVVAEDNDTNRLVIVRILERTGARVRGAASGAAALALFEARRPDLVVTDLQMGEMSGYELTARIRVIDRRERRRTPIVALTANAQAGERERCLEAGMDGFMTKPFTSERLARELLVVLGRAETTAVKAPASSSAHPFARALDYLDGDADLLQAAATVARREMLERDASMRAALERRDCAALAVEAHRARYAWSLFAPEGDSRLVDRVEDRARAGDFDGTAEATRTFLARQSDAAEAIGTWLSGTAP